MSTPTPYPLQDHETKLENTSINNLHVVVSLMWLEVCSSKVKENVNSCQSDSLNVWMSTIEVDGESDKPRPIPVCRKGEVEAGGFLHCRETISNVTVRLND